MELSSGNQARCFEHSVCKTVLFREGAHVQPTNPRSVRITHCGFRASMPKKLHPEAHSISLGRGKVDGKGCLQKKAGPHCI